MLFPSVTLSDWRTQVEKELAGKPFDKVLLDRTLEGLVVAPLYTEAPAVDPAARGARGEAFLVCPRVGSGTSVEEQSAELDAGADGLWTDVESVGALLQQAPARGFFVVEPGGHAPSEVVERLPSGPGARLALAVDPLAGAARRGTTAGLTRKLAAMGVAARALPERAPGATGALVSTLPYHEAGADAVDEVALALASGVVVLEALRQAGLSADEAARQVALQVAVGRDTFLELSKLRALRVCWAKLLVAAGAAGAHRSLVHGVCSSRTLTARDPWVNMLRGTTQVFAAVLGGADVVTPLPFDAALGTPSALGRRLARNTGLVLREESLLGRVSDPAGGSYYLDTLTDTLARDAWSRFRTLQQEGGIVDALESGALAARLERTWTERLERVARRKTPVLGVSEFANLDETLPAPAPEPVPDAGGGLPPHRDSEAFEALRLRAEQAGAPEVVLVILGGLAESRPRAGFASGFFAAGGLRTREVEDATGAAIVCMCGTDERYAEKAVARTVALKAAGCRRVLLAGRPGALEAALREAGIDGFIYVGSDLVAVLSELVVPVQA